MPAWCCSRQRTRPRRAPVCGQPGPGRAACFSPRAKEEGMQSRRRAGWKVIPASRAASGQCPWCCVRVVPRPPARDGAGQGASATGRSRAGGSSLRSACLVHPLPCDVVQKTRHFPDFVRYGCGDRQQQRGSHGALPSAAIRVAQEALLAPRWCEKPPNFCVLLAWSQWPAVCNPQPALAAHLQKRVPLLHALLVQEL